MNERQTPLSICQRLHRVHGFTLVELVVAIVIVAVLAAIAVPRYIAIGTDARIAALKTLASTLNSTSQNVRVLCKLNPSCDYSSQGQPLTISGQAAYVNYGWLAAGSNLDSTHINGWINYSGFTAVAPPGGVTIFTMDGAPVPSNCSVSYDNPYVRGPAALPIITTTTSGC